MKGDLGSQLADIFKKGLASDPKAAASLASSLSSHVNDNQDGMHTKAEANYHTASDSKRECGTCDNFDGQSGCKIVSGQISADGTCDFWSGSSQDSSSSSDGQSQDSQPSDSVDQGGN